ncbi:MAG: fumarylacetoacetate hydrolase family protein, partial [Sulfitobacter sp.]
MTLMKSWVSSANNPDCPFPLNNLPYGVFSVGDSDPRCGVAIGDMILDMASMEEEDLILLHFEPVFDVPYWNDVMDLGPEAWETLRARLIELLTADSPDQARVAPHLIPMADARLHMPMVVSEFTDFYASRHHATNVGTMFRGAENALPPNWLHIPIGYNGRASTVVISGTDIHRPNGQLKPPSEQLPSFGPCKRLDIELEMGAIIGTSTDMGQPVTVAQADEMIFGYVLLNDWSARDIQAWEYQPLGPFQAKAFATSISPWIVTRAALEPFRAPTPEREFDLLPHLQEPGPMLYDIDLSVIIEPEG